MVTSDDRQVFAPVRTAGTLLAAVAVLLLLAGCAPQEVTVLEDPFRDGVGPGIGGGERGPDGEDFSCLDLPAGQMFEFGAMPVGSVATAQIRVQNLCPEPITLLGVALVAESRPAEEAAFQVDTVNSLPIWLAPGDDAMIQVVFTPTEPGDYVAELYLLLDGPGTQEVMLLLLGWADE